MTCPRLDPLCELVFFVCLYIPQAEPIPSSAVFYEVASVETGNIDRRIQTKGFADLVSKTAYKRIHQIYFEFFK